jgi:2-polyprenyl-3-methyl-5-hydroxy-6-metoxy-1,4-benzoquinol methylase
LYPKLTEIQLDELYSFDYIKENSEIKFDVAAEDTTRFLDLKEYLEKQQNLEGKTFLDYGCGSNPVTLGVAKKLNLDPFGMELSKEVRDSISQKSDFSILSREEVISSGKVFDYIFLGDVLEHLINPIFELQNLQKVMSTKGVLIAQGPLQGQKTVSHLFLKIFSFLTPWQNSYYPPYHVSLASKKSMQELFAKSDFKVKLFTTFETAWPAPNGKELLNDFTFRNLVLFLLKKLDTGLSKTGLMNGSRYFAIIEFVEKT